MLYAIQCFCSITKLHFKTSTLVNISACMKHYQCDSKREASIDLKFFSKWRQHVHRRRQMRGTSYKLCLNLKTSSHYIMPVLCISICNTVTVSEPVSNSRPCVTAPKLINRSVSASVIREEDIYVRVP